MQQTTTQLILSVGCSSGDASSVAAEGKCRHSIESGQWLWRRLQIRGVDLCSPYPPAVALMPSNPLFTPSTPSSLALSLSPNRLPLCLPPLSSQSCCSPASLTGQVRGQKMFMRVCKHQYCAPVMGKSSSKLRIFALQLWKYTYSPLRCYGLRIKQCFYLYKVKKKHAKFMKGQKVGSLLWLSLRERSIFFILLSWMMMPLLGWLIDEDAVKPIGSRRHCLLSRTNCESLLHLPPQGNSLTPHSVRDVLPCSVSAKMNNACASHTDCFARGLSGNFDW